VEAALARIERPRLRFSRRGIAHTSTQPSVDSVGALLTAVLPLFAATGRVRFRVLDSAGDSVPKASISVRDSEDKTVQCVESDESGEAILTGLPLGDLRFAVTSSGFVKRQLTLTFHGEKEVKVEVHMWVPITGTIIEVKPKPPRKRHGWLLY
jgi:hypothetical protein